jgi:hypothetical protein
MAAGRSIAAVIPNSAHVVSDEKYSGMWRIGRPDGSLLDITKLTWDCDGAIAVARRFLRAGTVQKRAPGWCYRRCLSDRPKTAWINGTVQCTLFVRVIGSRPSTRRGR